MDLTPIMISLGILLAGMVFLAPVIALFLNLSVKIFKKLATDSSVNSLDDQYSTSLKIALLSVLFQFAAGMLSFVFSDSTPSVKEDFTSLTTSRIISSISQFLVLASINILTMRQLLKTTLLRALAIYSINFLIVVIFLGLIVAMIMVSTPAGGGFLRLF